jgi:hypothetical protein
VYTVTGLSSQSCSATSTILISTSACNDLPELTKNMIRVFPNPFKETLSISNVGEADIEIVNLIGQSVRKKTISDESRLDLSDLPKGIYFLTVHREGNDLTFRIVKE